MRVLQPDSAWNLSKPPKLILTTLVLLVASVSWSTCHFFSNRYT